MACRARHAYKLTDVLHCPVDLRVRFRVRVRVRIRIKLHCTVDLFGMAEV